MKQIKIRKDLWDDMVSGKKRYEFRKLSKGLISGTYECVSIEGKYVKCELCDGGGAYQCINGGTCDIFIPKEIYGTAELKPVRVFAKNMESNVDWVFNENEHFKTKQFVEEYYLNQYDFLQCEISNVKEAKND